MFLLILKSLLIFFIFKLLLVNFSLISSQSIKYKLIFYAPLHNKTFQIYWTPVLSLIPHSWFTFLTHCNLVTSSLLQKSTCYVVINDLYVTKFNEEYFILITLWILEALITDGYPLSLHSWLPWEFSGHLVLVSCSGCFFSINLGVPYGWLLPFIKKISNFPGLSLPRKYFMYLTSNIYLKSSLGYRSARQVNLDVL